MTLPKITHFRFKWEFNQLFAILAYLSLFAFIVYCTIVGKREDARDAWIYLGMLITFFFRRSEPATSTPQPSQKVSVETFDNKTDNEEVK